MKNPTKFILLHLYYEEVKNTMFEKQAVKYENNTNEKFSSLVDMYYARVYYHCIKIMKNDYDAADITQNTFIKAFIKLNHLKDENAFGAWIFTICNNEINMFYRKNKNMDITTPKLEERNSFASLYAAIDSLDEKYKNVIILKYFSDFKLSEIANITCLPEKTIKSRLYEARKILKALLSDNTVLKNLQHNKKGRCIIMSIARLMDLGAKVIPCMSVWGQKELIKGAKDNAKFSEEVLNELSRIKKGKEFVLECNGSISYDEAIKILACCDEAVLYRLNNQDYKTWRNGKDNPILKDIAEYLNTGGYIDSIEMILYVPSIIETVNWYKKYLGWDGDNSEEDEKYGYSQIRAYNNETSGYMYNTFKGLHIRSSKEKSSTNSSCFVMVTSIEKLYEKLVSTGWNKITEIKDRGWGTKGFVLEDLNGFKLEFCEWIC
jgi:RNA polymerase sigma-70 factor (ECF subfamily)